MQPYDDYAYDPIAEAVGWVVRSCAGVEIWLATVVSNVCDVNFAVVEKWQTKKQLERLVEFDASAAEIGQRINALFQVRHGLVHGLGEKSPDRLRLRTELRDRANPYSPKIDHFDRAKLVGLADKAVALQGELQLFLTQWANSEDRE